MLQSDWSKSDWSRRTLTLSLTAKNGERPVKHEYKSVPSEKISDGNETGKHWAISGDANSGEQRSNGSRISSCISRAFPKEPSLSF